MTRILLHPQLLRGLGARGGARVALSPPWYWWRLSLRTSPDGSLLHQSYDDPTNVTEVSFMFDLLDDAEIHDPPAMHLRHYIPTYDYTYGDPYRPLRSLMASGPEGEVDVVWYRQPGPRWQQLPGNTCRPGDYQIMTGERRELRNEDAVESMYMQNMPMLRWDQVAVDNPSLEGRRIAAAFGLPGAMVDRTPRTLDEHCQDIWDAIRTYESQMARRPSAVLMNDQDYRELRRLATQDDMNRGLYEHAALTQRTFDRVMGLEIRTERGVPSGTYIVVDDRMGYEPLSQSSPNSRGYTLSDIGSMRGGFAATLGQMGILTPNEVREIEGRPPFPPDVPSPLATAVLPESEVIDEIDRLVNDSIRPGPRDDYNADRYDKCAECFHDWHGLECEASRCDCINTDWLAG